jgi:hypothetical protein
MFKLILLIAGGCVLFFGVIIFLIYKTCYITYLTDKVFSADGAYYVQAQQTECEILDRYTTDVIITRVKHSLLEKLNGSSSEDVLILKSDSPSVSALWVDKKTLKVRYSSCQTTYTKKKSWKDIMVIYEGKC